MKSKQLKIKRDGLHGELEVLANKAELSAEEKTRWTDLQKQVKDLDSEIMLAEEQEEFLRTRAAESGRIITPADHRELKDYSFARLLQGILSGKLDGLELEMHQEAEREAAEMGRKLSGFGMPSKILHMPTFNRADITTSTAPMVQTNLVGFVDYLYSKLFCVAAGAQVMSGLTGNVAIPRQSTAATVSWQTEAGAAGDAGSDTDSISITPKRLTAYQDLTKQLINQSAYNVEQLLRNAFVSSMYVALEEAIIQGASNGPTGILSSGIGDVAGGANGAAPTLANMLSLIEKVGTANAEFGSLAFAVSPKGRWKLQSTALESGHPERVWAVNVPDQLLGYKAFVSTCVPDDLTKGNQSEVCSAIIFGNWAELIIAQFGPLDVLVDPYTQGLYAKVRVVLNAWFDSAVKHAGAFSAMKDAKCSS